MGHTPELYGGAGDAACGPKENYGYLEGYDVMASSGGPVVAFSAINRWRFGFTKVRYIPIEETPVRVVVPPAMSQETGEDTIIVIQPDPINHPDELFVIENRHRVTASTENATFDIDAVEPEGIFIYHTNAANPTQEEPFIDLENDPNRCPERLLPYQGEFSSSSIPNSNFYDGQPSYLTISRIQQDSDNNLSFWVSFPDLGRTVPDTAILTPYENLGRPGSSFTFIGENFTPSAVIDISVNGALVGSAAVDSNGVSVFAIVFPEDMAIGDYEVTATERNKYQVRTTSNRKAQVTIRLNRRAKLLQSPVDVPTMSAEQTLTDLEILDLTVVNPPLQILVDETVTITLREMITNNGPSGPTDVSLTNTAIAPADSVITPNEIRATELALGVSEQRVIEQTFTLQCKGYGRHTFAFASEIRPLNVADKDPDVSNNQVRTTFDVECVLPIAIDVVPAQIHLRGNNVVPVLALDNEAGEYGLPFEFEASAIEPLNVRFGSYDTVWNDTGGASETHGKGHRNGKGMMLHFRASETGLTVDDTAVCLKGTWYDSDGNSHTFFGCDEVVIRD